MSTYPGNSYVYMNGTSMATPYVAGVAGLVISYISGGGYNYAGIKDTIIKSSDTLSNLTSYVSTGKRLNLFKTLQNVRTKSLANEYQFPWYDDSDTDGNIREAWIVVANPSMVEPRTVSVYFKGVKRYEDIWINPGSSQSFQFDEEVGGPVKVVSTNGVNIYSTQRVRFESSFNEMFGM